MSIQAFFVRTATVIHPALVPSYGDGLTEDYVEGTTEIVKGWLHQLSESEQQTSTRDAEVSTHVWRCPAGSNIIASDRLRIDGQLFDVDGPPASVWRPAGEHHMKVSLRYSDG